MQYRHLAVVVAAVVLLILAGAWVHQADALGLADQSSLASAEQFDHVAKQAPTPKPSTDTVYITRTGEKFHTGSCRHLAKSKIAISRADAIKKGYTACKVCKP